MRPGGAKGAPGTHCDSFRVASGGEAKFCNFSMVDLQAKSSENASVVRKSVAGGSKPGSSFLASLAAFAPTEASGLKSGFRDIHIYLRSAQRKPESFCLKANS